MVLKYLSELFERDLNRLREEMLKYPVEKDMWIGSKQIKNSGGNLALHLVGNLHHFIGHTIGGTDYKRDRVFEFSGRDVPREELILQIEGAIPMIQKALDNLSTAELEKEYPLQVFGKPMTTGYFLLHLQGHLNYHLGQVNYHRRLLADTE